VIETGTEDQAVTGGTGEGDSLTVDEPVSQSRSEAARSEDGEPSQRTARGSRPERLGEEGEGGVENSPRVEPGTTNFDEPGATDRSGASDEEPTLSEEVVEEIIAGGVGNDGSIETSAATDPVTEEPTPTPVEPAPPPRRLLRHQPNPSLPQHRSSPPRRPPPRRLLRHRPNPSLPQHRSSPPRRPALRHLLRHRPNPSPLQHQSNPPPHLMNHK
jgi:hypothetical protein